MLLIDCCVFVLTEKEERIKKEKEQGTYKEKVSVGEQLEFNHSAVSQFKFDSK